MSITAEKKNEVIKKFAKVKGDTGSPQVQIAILTERINNLTEHLRSRRKDFSTRRGLLKLIGKRKRLQVYYQKNEPTAYSQLIKDLGLRR